MANRCECSYFDRLISQICKKLGHSGHSGHRCLKSFLGEGFINSITVTKAISHSGHSGHRRSITVTTVTKTISHLVTELFSRKRIGMRFSEAVTNVTAVTTRKHGF
jgi:hypothetical protein